MEWLTHVLLFVVAFIANLFSAFSGGGGGLLQFPVLILLGLPFAIALATHKVATVALGLGATLRNLREGRLEQRLTLFILATGLPGVVLGASVILAIPDRPAQIALGLLTMALGSYSFFQPALGQTHNPVIYTLPRYLIGGGVLFVIGVLNGSLSSGTGLFVTLWLIRWFGMDYRHAVAYTMILVGLFWNGCGALTLGLLGEIRWDWLPALITGALLGGYAGAHLAITAGNRWIKRVFEVITLLVGVSLLVN